MAGKKNKGDLIDLSGMGRADLMRLIKDAEKQLKQIEKSERKAALDAAERAAKEHGFSLGELTGAGKPAKTAAPAKYRHPENSDLTWSGRGRRPSWLRDVDDLSAYEI